MNNNICSVCWLARSRLTRLDKFLMDCLQTVVTIWPNIWTSSAFSCLFYFLLLIFSPLSTCSPFFQLLYYCLSTGYTFNYLPPVLHSLSLCISSSLDLVVWCLLGGAIRKACLNQSRAEQMGFVLMHRKAKIILGSFWTRRRSANKSVNIKPRERVNLMNRRRWI